MTVAVTAHTAQLVWTGVETQFAPGLVTIDVDHIAIVAALPSGPLPLVRGFHYQGSLSPAGSVSAAPAIFQPLPAMPAASPGQPVTLTFTRATPSTQPLDLSTGAFDPDVLERALDGGALRDAEFGATASRAVTVGVGQTPPVFDLAAFAGGGIVGVDGGGAIVRVPSGTPGATINSTQILDSTVSGRALLTAATVAAQRALLDVPTNADMALRVSTVTPREFAGVGNGIAADQAAVLAAAAEAAVSGRVLVIDRNYRIAANITIDVPIWYGPIGRFTVDAGVTLTINRMQFAGTRQRLFFGAGSVAGAIDGQRWNVCWFGALGNDAADCTAPFLRAFALQRAFIPAPGVYRVNEMTFGACDILADRDAEISFHGPANDGVMMTVRGAVHSSILLNDDASGTAASLGYFANLVAGGAVTAGDWVALASTDIFDPNPAAGSGDNVAVGEIKRVLSQANGRVRFDSPLRFRYRTAASATLHRLLLVPFFRVRGGRWYGARMTSATTDARGASIWQTGTVYRQNWLRLVGVIAPEIDEVEVSDFHAVGLQVTDCVRGHCRNSHFRNTIGRIGYGLCPSNMTVDFETSCCTFENTRHAWSQGAYSEAGVSSLLGLVGVTIAPSVIRCRSQSSDGFGDPFDTHGACVDAVMTHNIIGSSATWNIVHRGTGGMVAHNICHGGMQGAIYSGNDVTAIYDRGSSVNHNIISGVRPYLKQIRIRDRANGWLLRGMEITQGSNRAEIVTYIDFDVSGQPGGDLFVVETNGSITTGLFTITGSPVTGEVVSIVAAQSRAYGIVAERMSGGGIAGNVIDMQYADAYPIQMRGARNVLVTANHTTVDDGAPAIHETVSSDGLACLDNHYAANYLRRRAGSGGAALSNLTGSATRSGNRFSGYATEV